MTDSLPADVRPPGALSRFAQRPDVRWGPAPIRGGWAVCGAHASLFVGLTEAELRGILPSECEAVREAVATLSGKSRAAFVASDLKVLSELACLRAGATEPARTEVSATLSFDPDARAAWVAQMERRIAASKAASMCRAAREERNQLQRFDSPAAWTLRAAHASFDHRLIRAALLGLGVRAGTLVTLPRGKTPKRRLPSLLETPRGFALVMPLDV